MTPNEDPVHSSPPSNKDGVGAAGKTVVFAALKLFSLIGKSVVETGTLVASKSASGVRRLFESKPMSMTRCSSGHYFDPHKSATCPLCATSHGMAPDPISSPTRDSNGAPREITTSQQTVGFMVREQGIDPTVGWLVCIAGPERGKDFRIRSERNLIGRAPQMHIAINDDSVSRENHASIIFNPIKSGFKIQPGESRGLVYLNGEEVLQPMDLKSGDKISLGASELMFVPFAGTFFDWK